MRWISYSLVVLAGLSVLSCQPSQPVHAANEDRAVSPDRENGPIRGDLYSIDLKGKMMVIRVENGMAQTFRWDETTVFDGNLPAQDVHSRNNDLDTVAVMKRLNGYRGSDLNVEWKDFNDEKMATFIHITDLIASSAPGHRRARARTRQ